MSFEIQIARSDNYHTEYFINSLNRTLYRSICFWKVVGLCSSSKSEVCTRRILVEINESKAIHLHFYAKINGYSLVKKALRMPQNAPNCTIYFKISMGGGHAPWPPRLFWIHILYRLATRLLDSALWQRCGVF